MTENDFETLNKIVLARLDNLSSNLTYHSITHTLDVVEKSFFLATSENVGREEITILKTAALFHDTGFLQTYSNHEEKGCEIFLETISGFNFTAEEKLLVQELIMATQLPQRPETLLQQIICDADLDYLGRDDFFPIADSLRKEFLHYKVVANDKEWEKMQLNFLKNHTYHTSTSRILREPLKQIHFSKLS